MQKVYYYIGSNNRTKELETEKIEAVLNKFFDGYTAYEVAGYWKGLRERTFKVEVVTNLEPAKLTAIAKILASELGQEAVAMEVIESTMVFVQALNKPTKEETRTVLELAAASYKPFGLK